MQLQISPSLRHVTLVQSKGGVRDIIKVKSCGQRKVSYKMVIYFLILVTFLVRFLFAFAPDPDTLTCTTSLGCLRKRLAPNLLGTMQEPMVPKVVYEVLNEPGRDERGRKLWEGPQNLDQFMEEIMIEGTTDPKTFALKLRAMVRGMEERTRRGKMEEFIYRHVASSSIPKAVYCLGLRLAHEHSTNAAARRQLPSPELVPSLIDTSLRHFVLASDNVIAAAVVVASVVRSSLRPQNVVVHIITDRKTLHPMQAWFSLHPLGAAIVEVKALHHFDWFTRGRVPVLEAMEKDHRLRSRFHGASSALLADSLANPNLIASKLQALSPKYTSAMNHIRIHLPELFPNLNKVVFLDDDIVVQTDLSLLWDIDLNGKVNGAVETCRGDDKFVMSKRLKNYLNFSHPLISSNFDPQECAWAYGMNIFDLNAWRKTNISKVYHNWIQQNLERELRLWQLGTLPPALIAFRGNVKAINPFWHMLGLGYQQNITLLGAQKAGVVHFNGRAKPWLDIAFPHLRPLWSKYIDFSDPFIRSCRILPPQSP